MNNMDDAGGVDDDDDKVILMFVLTLIFYVLFKYYNCKITISVKINSNFFSCYAGYIINCNISIIP